MKKPIAGGAPTPTSTDVNPHTNNYLLFQQQQGDESFFKLSLPLMVSSFWLPFLLFLSTFGFNHGDEGNVDVHNHNPYTKEQDQNHPDTDRVLLEFNVSDSTAPSQDPHTSIDTETNQIQGTTQYEEQVTKVLGYSALVCEREIQDSYVEKKQEDIQTGKTHLTYLDLDEFRNTTQQDIGLNGAPSGLVNITHRLEPDGTKYNYASASKGAKVLAYNKEANGATNILGKDHDRYLRNPCSVSDKYVIIELSEETLVDAVKIANFEHHSSNFKEFSLSGSLVFPTENWYHLGNFVAENVKHHQYFKLPEPKWARYLNLTLISQYGWEFYCTLNVVEVYGVDAIERMLEDLIVTSEESSTNPNSTATSAQSKGNVDDVEGVSKKIESGGGDEGKRVDDDVAKKLVSASKIPELVAKGNGRIHGDAVLKILMQKVRLLEKNLSLLEDFIKELNKRQGDVLPKVDVEIGKYSGLVEKTRMEIKEILLWKTTVEKEIADLVTWKAFVSSHLESIVKENAMLREAIANVASDQESLDKAELTFLTMSVSFVVAVILKAISDRLFNSSAHSPYFKTQSGDRSWKLLFLTCVVTGVIVFNLY